MKFVFVVALAILIGCATDPEPGDFTALELRDFTPIMQFKGDLVPDECFSEEHLKLCDEENAQNCKHSVYDPSYKIYCYHYIENITPLLEEMVQMGWKYDSDESGRGDCGAKYVYNKTVDHRKLRVYIKNCESSFFVSSDRFYFNVEYE